MHLADGYVFGIHDTIAIDITGTVFVQKEEKVQATQPDYYRQMHSAARNNQFSLARSRLEVHPTPSPDRILVASQ